MAITESTSQSLLSRLWIYQSERFPLGKTAVLLSLFSAASTNVSATLSGAVRPGLVSYLAAFLGAFVFFVHLRVCDEIKDAEDDARYRPERPIPRGLVSLPTIINVGLAFTPIAVIAAIVVAPALVWLLALVWLWMALMTAEFLVPEWLKTRPLVYLVSHMLIMPLIDLYVTACEWLPPGNGPPAGLWLFLALSFVNGCVLEIGRKIYAPESERTGVDTYSKLWGIDTAIAAWCACLMTSTALLIGVGIALDCARPIAGIALLALAAAIAAAMQFRARPLPERQQRIDLAAGLWVAACYATASFVPLIVRTFA